MEPKQTHRIISQVYLSLVPVLVSIAGFGIGYISYKIYLPIWIFNVVVMIIAARILGAHRISSNDAEKKQLAIIGLFLIAPWMLISIFFGLGPPPEKAIEWVATATEQKLRYSFLTISGILITFGFALLRENLKNTRGNLYSYLGFIAIMIVIPLFVINMAFWCSFLVESFKISVLSASEKMPDWFLPVAKQFELVSVIEVALTYLATAAFAASLKSAGWFGKIACLIYITISIMCLLLIVLSTFTPAPIATAGFFLSIPAIPFVLPYIMGINLLRRAGQ